MKFSYALISALLAAAVPAWAVYAPIPEPEQGNDFTAAVRAGWTYDSNIFGAPTGAISSNVWEVAPRLSYHASLTDQTFFSASYGLTLDEFENRPGTKLLDSHELSLRLAHAFTKATSVDFNNVLTVDRNPASLLNGVFVNADQSFTRDQFDGRFVTSVSPKVGIEAKVRGTDTRFRNDTLARSLDRLENLYGLAANYAVLPEVKTVAEYRHLDVFYRKEGELKNKHSEYLMTGVDYDAARKITLSTRVGAEWRRRAIGSRLTAPFAEVSGRYQYAEQSFLTAGYGYTLDETSDPARFSDERVNRFFANVQHAFRPLIVGSLSADYEPARLKGWLGHGDIRETANRAGAALSYLPTKNWVVSATYDFDQIDSDDPSRSVRRNRVGVSGSYTF